MKRYPYGDNPSNHTVDYGTASSPPLESATGGSAENMVGRTISGKFKLIRRIGQGGMGTIFEAEHAFIGNRVAVKLLHESFAARREPVQRLYREARATGTIGHPNIITVHDVGETEEGIPYLVMELLRGESLGALVQREGRLSVRFVLEMSIQILSALNAAHEAGIIHRDLKSDNVFLTPAEEGRIHVKLLDFGISKFSEPEQEVFKLTQTGSVLGTPYYMSPEQAAGRKDLDFRIDVYSTGIIMYETLVGKLPHGASNYNALINEIINEDIQPFRWQRPDIPPRLEATVLKAMSRERDERWANSLDLMEELVIIRDQLPALSLVDPTQPVSTGRQGLDFSTLSLDESLMSVEEADSPLGFESGDDFGKPWRLAMWAGMVAIPLLLVVGVFFWVLRQPGTSAVNNNVVPAAAQKGTIDATHESAPAAPLHPQTVKLTIKRQPANATVSYGDILVSEAGITLPFGNEPINFVATAEGYQEKSLQFVPVRDGIVDVVLEPLAPAMDTPPLEQETAGEVLVQDQAETGAEQGDTAVSKPIAKTKRRVRPPRGTKKKSKLSEKKAIEREQTMDNPF